MFYAGKTKNNKIKKTNFVFTQNCDCFCAKYSKCVLELI